VMRILRAFKLLNNTWSAVGRQMVILLLTILSIVFLSAGLVHVVENELIPDDVQKKYGDGPSFGNCIYFIIVTISTVGACEHVILFTYGRSEFCVMSSILCVCTQVMVTSPLAQVLVNYVYQQ
jgi:hypothetical protein